MDNQCRECIVDTNIFIDLNNGDILENLFRIGYNITTTDFALHEFKSVDTDSLHCLGLNVRELSADELDKISELNSCFSKLSVVDVSLLYVSSCDSCILLTGDGPLRSCAMSKNIVVHGLLWILDSCVNAGVMDPPGAADALSKMRMCGSRLPEIECQKRFELWK